jgi:hypothetical protein
MRRGAGVPTLEKNQNSSRQGAKAQRSAKKKSLVFFANFANFAALRETGFSVAKLIHSFSRPCRVTAKLAVPQWGRRPRHRRVEPT